ncbi:LamG-like jellyroll fold domain-containing protein [Flavobacterium taihuense]|uniref:T9SS type A sorting domain-containing protein n=1 Tax=Flavobacterium taihuense TaxID=2857508 RepID=A0ABS6XW90_9FLAO|nr:LamG-like jellyroll fold domain-containing protein [Flavobacterium taihuense]MBW4360944.1 T9SS type A sorting domain-containing protein [Flavobacterium taihuense]
MKKIILFAIFVLSFSITAQIPIQEFKFNGNLSNTQNNILFSGVVNYVNDRTGVANRAIRINNNAIEATIPNLPLSNTARTISIWVKYNDVAVDNYIWGYGLLYDAQFFGLLQQSTTTSKSDLNFAGWGVVNDVIVTTTIIPDTWYNYTVTYDGLSLKIYRNGALIKSSISPKKITSGIVFDIGKMSKWVSMNADLDDLKIYDVALSSDEVAAIYKDSPILAPNDVVGIAEKGAASKAKTAASNPKVVLDVPKETITFKTSEIYSTKGQKVYTGNKNDIDISTLPEGTYLLKVSNSQQNSSAKKLTLN